MSSTIIGKHANYVIISGYVAILFGRSRVSDDIDVFVEELDDKKFASLCGDLEKAGFWLVNSSAKAELFKMLEDGLAIRIAEHGKAVPNIEIKFPEEELDYFTLQNPPEVY